MTVKEARRDLPAVTVRMPDKKIYPARVTGRLNQFATVTISYIFQPHKKKLCDFGGKAWIAMHCSWECIARAADSGKPIIYA